MNEIHTLTTWPPLGAVGKTLLAGIGATWVPLTRIGAVGTALRAGYTDDGSLHTAAKAEMACQFGVRVTALGFLAVTPSLLVVGFECDALSRVHMASSAMSGDPVWPIFPHGGDAKNALSLHHLGMGVAFMIEKNWQAAVSHLQQAAEESMLSDARERFLFQRVIAANINLAVSFAGIEV